MTFLDEKFLGNSIEDWGIAIGIVIGSFIATKIAYWVIANIVTSLTKKTKTNLDDVLIETLEKPIIYSILIQEGCTILEMNTKKQLSFIKNVLM